MNDTQIYDLLSDEWITDRYIINPGKIPILSHMSGYAAFYTQRQEQESMHSICALKEIDWGRSSSLIREEGFYIFGGLLGDGKASGNLWILKLEKDDIMKWRKGDSLTTGSPPQARYSHALTFFEHENVLIISGGRNDQEKKIFSDLFFLSLDTLQWTEIRCFGTGVFGRSDHHMIHINHTKEFIILGGVDENYHLSNKLTKVTFDP